MLMYCEERGSKKVELFKNRPFALLCCIFIMLSALIYRADMVIKLFLTALLAVFCALAYLVYRILKDQKKRMAFFFAFLCAVSALLSPLSQIAGFELKRDKALEYCGEHYVTFTVENVNYTGEYSSEYGVKITDVDGDNVSFSSICVTAFSSELSIGDKASAIAEIYPSGEKLLGYSRDSAENVYIDIAVYNRENLVVTDVNRTTLRGYFNLLRERLSLYIDGTVGDQGAELCKAMLLGDKSGLDGEILKAFRRSGTSHLLAVSGLHMSVLLGCVGLILEKLSLRKSLRYVILSIAAVAFLILTGFSMSASRSVVMTLSVYGAYLFVKENDPITSLFASVALIILIFPHSVFDVGLMLSFFATLGILAAYLPITAYIKRFMGKRYGARAARIFGMIFYGVLLTLICNTFILLIIWYVFGEISVVGLISNPMLSPLSEVYMILSAVALVFGRVPLIGRGIVFLLCCLGELIEQVAVFFGNVSGGVLSLRYPFAGVIICLMAAALGVMLVIKLKRRWMIILPSIAAILCFCICFAGFELMYKDRTRMTYYGYGDNEMIVLGKGYSAAVCDMSAGSYSFLSRLDGLCAEGYSTEISEYVVTHYHSGQPAALEKIFRYDLVRCVCLPFPDNDREYEILSKIAVSAERYRVDLVLYGEREQLRILDGWCAVINKGGCEDGRICLGVSFGNELLSYIGSGDNPEDIPEELMENGDTVIFGRHGARDNRLFPCDLGGKNGGRIIFCDREDAERSGMSFGGREVFAYPSEQKEIKIHMTLS